MKYRLIVMILCSSCTIKFDVTSERTALENQILGTYKELDDDIILLSSVRAVNSDGEIKSNSISITKKQALQAKQNQKFNQDDIWEYKSRQFIGEGEDGKLYILPKSIGLVKDLTKRERAIVETIIAEENRDRNILWGHIINLNPELNNSHFSSIIETFKNQIYEQSHSGFWFQKNSKWSQKP